MVQSRLQRAGRLSLFFGLLRGPQMMLVWPIEWVSHGLA
jgi:hypothetical protein